MLKSFKFGTILHCQYNGRGLLQNSMTYHVSRKCKLKENPRNQEGPSHIEHDSSSTIDNTVCWTLGYRRRQNKSTGDCNSQHKNGKANRQIVISTSKIKRRNHNKAQLHYTVGNTIPGNCQRDVAMNLKCL
jgi:hypothetical protein